ncbi:MAG TPA: zinc-ribbon and DUF3426 domain-containing protein [Steroidobacteraceae bacterium]
MFTVCPKCALTLTVTAADLRIAQGFVRCGQCTNVFNALLALSDERQQTMSVPVQVMEEPAPGSESDSEHESESETESEAGSEHEAEPSDEPPEEESASDEAAPEDAPRDEPRAEEAAREEFAHEDAVSEGEYSIEQTSLEFNPAAANVAEIFVEPQAVADDEPTGTYESIVLRTQEPSPVEDHGTAPNPDDDLNDQLESLAARIEAARQNQLAQTHTGIQPLLMPIELAPPVPPVARPLLWRAALAALVVLLAAQAVDHYREELAVNPRLHRPLTALYALFGVSLTPHWDLTAYEVHQLGASTGAQSAGELTVRASVRNGAQQPQPLPLLRVTLLDRFGNRLASRDVPPRAYLSGAPAAAALLPPGERVDAQIAFVDPGKNAVGFEIDACLQAPSQRVHCANDAAAK